MKHSAGVAIIHVSVARSSLPEAECSLQLHLLRFYFQDCSFPEVVP